MPTHSPGTIATQDSPVRRRRPTGRLVLTATIFLTALVSVVGGAAAQTAPVRVVAVGRPPFVISSEAPPSGLSIDVWNAVAAELGVLSDLESVEEIGTALEMVASGERDVAVGPISITADRAEVVDFSQPYFHSSLSILAPVAGSLLDRFAPFLTETFITGALALLVILLIVGTLLWLAERRVNAEQFPEAGLSGVGNGIWMALVTMTTVGYGDRVPVSTPGRVVAGVWMLVSLVIASSLTAFLATALTLSQMEGSAIQTADQLRGRRVGVVAATTSEAFANGYGARAVAFPDLDAPIAALVRGDVEAVVFDRPMLRYALAERADLELELSSSSYQPQNYGFATARGAALLDDISLAILRLQENGTLADIESRWLGTF